VVRVSAWSEPRARVWVREQGLRGGDRLRYPARLGEDVGAAAAGAQGLGMVRAEGIGRIPDELLETRQRLVVRADVALQ
jgi:hypothetical protein